MWISKKKYEELVGRIDVIEKRISKFGPHGAERLDKCRDDIDDIQRVMENSKFGEITHESIFNKKTLFSPYEECNESKESKIFTRIYKDFKEYKIDRLYLYKPIFKVDNGDDNLIHVSDIGYTYEDGNKKEMDISYIVDLQNRTFIKTK